MITNELKKLAAEKAVEEINDGMILGLGTGSTFQFALEKISQRIKSGELKSIVGVCSSERTRLEATRLAVPLTTLNELCKNNNSQFPIDLTIDGADEVDENLNLIKGGGGALLGEKIIVQATKKFIVIVDEGKLSQTLGTIFAIPIEVLQKAEEVEKNFLTSLGANVIKRRFENNMDYITDEENIILDAKFKSIDNVNELSKLLNDRAGIVEHGIFEKRLVTKVVCAGKDRIIILEK